MNIESPLGNDLKVYNSDDSYYEYSDSDADPSQHFDLATSFEMLLRSVSLCNILQSHSKILVVDSRLPLMACLKSMSIYHRDFAFVYDSQNMCISGFMDELSIIKFLRNFDSYAGLDCAKFMTLVNPGIIHKMTDEADAYDGFELTFKNRINRLFVWSNERNAPIGYVTPSCYLFYMVQNLLGSHGELDHSLETVQVERCFSKISDKTTLLEALDFLILKDNLLMVDEMGKIVGILSRRKLAFYALKNIKKEKTMVYTTSVREILAKVDSKYSNEFHCFRVDPTISLKKAIGSILLSNDRALVYTDRTGADLVVTVWDLVRHLSVK